MSFILFSENHCNNDSNDINYNIMSINKNLFKRLLCNELHKKFKYEIDKKKMQEKFNLVIDTENEKVEFINTCDAMIHSRERGETFGLTIAEFSTFEKPIITYSNSPEKNHINILGDKGFYYTNYNELYEILLNINPSVKGYNCYTEFTPEKVMNKFKKVFLDA